jgi:hypothetical protein
MTKDEIFDKIDEVYGEHDGGVIYLNEERTNQIKEIIQQAINYTHCCKSDSEQLHTEVFELANKLAINGYGNEAVKMHGICNGM